MLAKEILEFQKPIKHNNRAKTFVSIIANDTYDLLSEIADELLLQENMHMSQQFRIKAGNILSIYGSCEIYEKEATVILGKVKELRRWASKTGLGARFSVDNELDMILRVARERSGLKNRRWSR